MVLDTQRLPDWFRAVQMREFPGEKILWAGMPGPGTVFYRSLAIWLFGIPWMAFTLFWEVSVIRSWLFAIPNGKGGPAGLGLVLWGVPFVLVGVGLMSAPLFAWWRARRTVHVVTDKRLVTISQGRTLKTQSVALRDIMRTGKTERTDRSGTLTVEMSPYIDSEGDKSSRSENLYGIPDVHAVETLLRNAREKLR